MKLNQCVTLIVFGTIFVVGGPTVAQAAETKPTPEMEAMMKKAQEYGAPAAAHKALEPFIGKWTNVIKFWMKPGDKAQESAGTSENTWILGGRYVHQKYTTSWNGQPFEGIGMTGYDNVRGEYQSLWLDNMATGMMYATGSYDEKAKSVNVAGTFSCPMTGEKQKWYRSEWKVLGADKHTYTSYDKTPEGKEFKSMEITFTRVK